MNNTLVSELNGVHLALAGGFEGLDESLWAAPTPCPGWTVRDLVAHLVRGDQVILSALRGEQVSSGVPGVVPDFDLGDDPVSIYRRSHELLMEALNKDGVLDQAYRFQFGEFPGVASVRVRQMDLLGHGWDLMRATGISITFSEEAIARTLRFVHRTGKTLPRGPKSFEMAQPVPEGAGPLDELAALLGRPLTA